MRACAEHFVDFGMAKLCFAVNANSCAAWIADNLNESRLFDFARTVNGVALGDKNQDKNNNNDGNRHKNICRNNARILDFFSLFAVHDLCIL